MLKSGIQIIKKNDLCYIVKSESSVKQFKPWLGDSFSFFYDFIMKNFIFPKKFGGDISKHYEILSQELKGVHGKHVLELATGSGSAVNFLPNDNQYKGTDISPGLLRRAVKSFRSAGFKDAEFYVASSDDLPFDDNLFDIVLCILSLNFFNDAKKTLQEIKRVATQDAVFICIVPVPERNKLQSTIRGTLYSEEDLERICEDHGFRYKSIPHENGALLYFKAIVQ
jgi:ubiquinone/menaquinone biosynthesis C-methylase UbiE